MTANPDPSTPVAEVHLPDVLLPDVLDALAGVAAGDALDAARRRRPDAREHAQGSFEALFVPVDPAHVSLAERAAVALFVARLHNEPAAVEFYGALLRETGGGPGLEPLIVAEATRAAGSGPYGAFKAENAPESVDGPVYVVSSVEVAYALGDRLAAALEHAHMLTLHPRDAARDHLQSLLDAGWSTTGIVTLSQLVAFLTFQLRVAQGLAAVRGAAVGETGAAGAEAASAALGAEAVLGSAGAEAARSSAALPTSPLGFDGRREALGALAVAVAGAARARAEARAVGVPAGEASGPVGVAEGATESSAAPGGPGARELLPASPRVTEPPRFTQDQLGWKPWLEPLPVAEFTERHYEGLVQRDRVHMPYFRLLARDPEALRERTLTDLDIFTNTDAGLPRRDREIAAAAASRVNGCVYCASVHARFATEQGADREDVQRLLDDGATVRISPRWDALFDATIALTATPPRFSAEHLGALQRVGFDELELIDAIQSAAFFNWANRLMLSLGEPSV